MPPSPARIRLLGPVAIAGDVIRAPKLACVLAVLALQPGMPVPQTDLIDRVWDGDPPDSVLSALYSYVARLRTALKAVPGAAIRRAGAHGYVLEVEPGEVDLHASRVLRDEARGLGRGEAALEAWRSACGLAGEEALVGIGGRWAEQTRAALAVERGELLAERYAAELEAGRHEAALTELVGLVDAAPLTEPLVRLLMLAYYRCGRPAEALARFEATRTHLRQELGTDPSQQLRDLQLRVLRQDPTLELVTAPVQLPADISGFTGRTEELKLLDQLADPAAAVALAAVIGPAGAGKTALAVHWGHSMVERFPGGLLSVNLRGFDDGETVAPREALSRLLVAMNLPGEAIPQDVDAAGALFRSITADRRVLVILDNARNAEQVRPLLPGAGCFTIVTSRDRLTGLIAVNGARPVPVGMLGPAEAVELLARILGPERVAAEPTAAERLAELCGHLVLALRIAAAYVAAEPHLRIADYVRELERRDRLDVLAVDDDPAAAVTANLDLSLRVLDAEARELFAQLGVLPGEDFTEELIGSLSELAEADTVRALRKLVGAHLLEQHQARRYRMHDLVRLYAARTGAQALSEPARATLIDGFITWHHDRAYRPVIAEETNMFVACEVLHDHPQLWRLVFGLRNVLNEGRLSGRLRQLTELAGDNAAAAGDAFGLFRMTSLRANTYRVDGDTASAIELGTRALALAESLSAREQTAAGGNLGIYLIDHGDFAGAAAAFKVALDLAIASENSRSLQIFVTTLARLLAQLGRYDEGPPYVESARRIAGAELTVAQRVGLDLSDAELQIAAGAVDQALQTVDAAMAAARQAAHPYLDMWCLNVQGRAQLSAGRPEAARDSFEEELRLARLRKLASFDLDILCDLGEALVELGEYRQAAELLPEVRRKWTDLSRGAQAFVDYLQARVHLGLGEYDAARAHAQVAVDIFAAMPWPARHELALVALAEAHAGQDPGFLAAADEISAPINRLLRARR